jgi:hypothetical protein
MHITKRFGRIATAAAAVVIGSLAGLGATQAAWLQGVSMPVGSIAHGNLALRAVSSTWPTDMTIPCGEESTYEEIYQTALQGDNMAANLVLTWSESTPDPSTGLVGTITIVDLADPDTVLAQGGIDDELRIALTAADNGHEFRIRFELGPFDCSPYYSDHDAVLDAHTVSLEQTRGTP